MGRGHHRHAGPGSWPAGMRVIVRKERPHPGAQLRFTDIDGHRFTCFATDTKRGQLADLELRHRRRARCEDRIRCAKDTGLRNLPLQGFAQNQIWCEIVALACELLAWMQMLALDRHRPPLGAQTAPPAPVRRRRAPRPQRPPPAATPRRTLALGRADHRRDHPGCRPSRPADQPEQPPTTRKEQPRARGTPPTRRDSRAARHGPTLKISPSRRLRPARSGTRKIEASACPGAADPMTPPIRVSWQSAGRAGGAQVICSGHLARRRRVVILRLCASMGGDSPRVKGHGPLLTVLTCIVTSDWSAQPCRLNCANSALYWSGG